jgi:hypothetical protein
MVVVKHSHAFQLYTDVVVDGKFYGRIHHTGQQQAVQFDGYTLFGEAARLLPVFVREGLGFGLPFLVCKGSSFGLRVLVCEGGGFGLRVFSRNGSDPVLIVFSPQGP